MKQVIYDKYHDKRHIRDNEYGEFHWTGIGEIFIPEY